MNGNRVTLRVETIGFDHLNDGRIINSTIDIQPIRENNIAINDKIEDNISAKDDNASNGEDSEENQEIVKGDKKTLKRVIKEIAIKYFTPRDSAIISEVIESPMPLRYATNGKDKHIVTFIKDNTNDKDENIEINAEDNKGKKEISKKPEKSEHSKPEVKLVKLTKEKDSTVSTYHPTKIENIKPNTQPYTTPSNKDTNQKIFHPVNDENLNSETEKTNRKKGKSLRQKMLKILKKDDDNANSKNKPTFKEEIIKTNDEITNKPNEIKTTSEIVDDFDDLKLLDDIQVDLIPQVDEIFDELYDVLSRKETLDDFVNQEGNTEINKTKEAIDIGQEKPTKKKNVKISQTSAPQKSIRGSLVTEKKQNLKKNDTTDPPVDQNTENFSKGTTERQSDEYEEYGENYDRREINLGELTEKSILLKTPKHHDDTKNTTSFEVSEGNNKRHLRAKELNEKRDSLNQYHIPSPINITVDEGKLPPLTDSGQVESDLTKLTIADKIKQDIDNASFMIEANNIQTENIVSEDECNNDSEEIIKNKNEVPDKPNVEFEHQNMLNSDDCNKMYKSRNDESSNNEKSTKIFRKPGDTFETPYRDRRDISVPNDNESEQEQTRPSVTESEQERESDTVNPSIDKINDVTDKVDKTNKNKEIAYKKINKLTKHDHPLNPEGLSNENPVESICKPGNTLGISHKENRDISLVNDNEAEEEHTLSSVPYSQQERVSEPAKPIIANKMESNTDEALSKINSDNVICDCNKNYQDVVKDNVEIKSKNEVSDTENIVFEKQYDPSDSKSVVSNEIDMPLKDKSAVSANTTIQPIKYYNPNPEVSSNETNKHTTKEKRNEENKTNKESQFDVKFPQYVLNSNQEQDSKSNMPQPTKDYNTAIEEKVTQTVPDSYDEKSVKPSNLVHEGGKDKQQSQQSDHEQRDKKILSADSSKTSKIPVKNISKAVNNKQIPVFIKTPRDHSTEKSEQNVSNCNPISPSIDLSKPDFRKAIRDKMKYISDRTSAEHNKIDVPRRDKSDFIKDVKKSEINKNKESTPDLTKVTVSKIQRNPTSKIVGEILKKDNKNVKTGSPLKDKETIEEKLVKSTEENIPEKDLDKKRKHNDITEIYREQNEEIHLRDHQKKLKYIVADLRKPKSEAPMQKDAEDIILTKGTVKKVLQRFESIEDIPVITKPKQFHHKSRVQHILQKFEGKSSQPDITITKDLRTNDCGYKGLETAKGKVRNILHTIENRDARRLSKSMDNLNVNAGNEFEMKRKKSFTEIRALFEIRNV